MYQLLNRLLLLAILLPLSSLADTSFHSDPVTADQVCTGAAPEQAASLCAGMKTAIDEAMEMCSGQGADARFCAIFGGNLYGLVQGCYVYGAELHADSRRLCKVVDTFVSAAASYCRQLKASGPELCALVQSDLIARKQIERYQASWLHQAHALQRELSAAQPMRDTLYVSTHNSFNATQANNPPTLSGSDANQRYVIADQLDMDVRGLEIDVHWVPSAEDGAFRATVCHGNQGHAGCSYEKSLRAELEALRAWLDANPGEVIVLDLEDNMNQQPDAVTGPDRYAVASADIHEILGDLLFLPGQTYGNGSVAPACGEGQPLDASIEDLRAAGKQVIIYSGCSYVHAGQSLMFSRDGTHTQQGSGSYIGIRAPDNCIFAPQDIADKWVRFYEDGTLVGATAGGASRQASIEEVTEMARCNINMPSLDQLQPFDGRLEALLWSWDSEQPGLDRFELKGGQRAVTVSNAAGRFELRALADARKSVKFRACRNPSAPLVAAGEFNPARWSVAGECAPPYVFAVPQNGLDNELLKMAKAAAAVEEVEVNLSYSASKGWNWPGR